MAKDLPTVAPTTLDEWTRWLDAEHSTSPGVWVKLAKKGVAGWTLRRSDALDVALCYGWIDGQAAPVDDSFWLQRFTPRRPRSMWSQVNRDKVTALIAAGRMQPAGHAQIEAAKRDGRWDAAYAPQSAATVPDDLQQALAATPEAERFFATISAANRYAVLYRVTGAKRPETRARRIAHYVDMLAQHRTLH